MAADADSELTDHEREVLEQALPALAPPPDFADRVLVGPARASTARWWIAAGVLTAAAVIAVIALRPQGTRGTLAARERTTAELGDRGVAVAETGAQLAWRIAGDGSAEIDQSTGNVFYRVERGGPFVVHTPAGDVRVTGTCFRIEVEPMSKQQMILSGTAGAAIAAAVVITVYEGHVIAQSRVGGAETGVPAGMTARIGSDGKLVPPPPLDVSATREQLLARAQAQRVEITQLQSRIGDLESKLGHARGDDRADTPAEDGRLWRDPSPEKLAQWAAECHVQVDMPDIAEFTPIPAGLTATWHGGGINVDEVDAYNAAIGELSKEWRQQLRALYIDATGDSASADTLSEDAMFNEIRAKGGKGEFASVLQKISAERAGLATPPADPSKLSPLERMLRGYSALGDRAEAALAKRVGPERARAIRGDGFGGRSSFSGCPDQ